jgi:hypothetical protein
VRLLFTITSLLIGFNLYAQDSLYIPTINTDRPDLTESSRAVPHKSLQIETGFLMDVINPENSGKYKTTLYSFPTPLIRWGLFKGIELRLFNTLISSTTEDPTIPVDERKSFGIGNLSIGTKINLLKEKGFRPEMALIAHLNLPTGSHEVSPDRIIFNIALSMSHTLSKKLSLGYNLGWFNGDDNNNGNGYYTLALGYGISPKFGVYIEGYGFFPNLDSATISLDGGFTYLLKPHMQFDISGGKGITFDTYFISFGFSVLFAQLY